MLDDHVPALHHMLTSAMVQGDSLKEFANIPNAIQISVTGGDGFIDSFDKVENSSASKPAGSDRHSLVMEDVGEQTLQVEKSILRVLRDQAESLDFLRRQLSTSTQERLNNHLAKRFKEVLERLGVAGGGLAGGLGGLFGGGGIGGVGGTGTGKTTPSTKKPPGKIGKLIGAAATAAASVGAFFGLKDLSTPTVPEAKTSGKIEAKVPTGTAVSPSAINDLAEAPKVPGAPAESVKPPTRMDKAKALLGKVSLAKVGAIGTAVTAIPAAIDAYNISTSDATATEKGNALGGLGGSVAGGVGGGIAGAKAGALAGAGIGAFFGGVGAAPGALIGGLVGSIGGSILGSSFGEDLGKTIGSTVGSFFEDEPKAPATSTGFSAGDNVSDDVPVVTVTPIAPTPKVPVPQGHTDAERVIAKAKEQADDREPKSTASAPAVSTVTAIKETETKDNSVVTNNEKEKTILKSADKVFENVAYATPAVVPTSNSTSVSNFSDTTNSSTNSDNSVANDNRSWYSKLQSWIRGDDKPKESPKTDAQPLKVSIPSIDTTINQPGLKPGVDGPRGLTEVDQRSASNPNFVSALRERESSNNYEANNGAYYGAYQIGNDALKDLGYKDKKNKWVGKDGVTSLKDFLANPEVQDKAVSELMTKNWSYLNASPIKEDAEGKPVYAKDMVGQKINGVTITESGLLAASHLGGAGSVAKMLKTDGATMPVDGNKVPIINYLQAMGGKDVSKETSQPSLVTGDIGTYTPAENVTYTVAGKNKALEFQTNVPIGRERLQYHESQYMADAHNVINRVSQVKEAPVTNVNSEYANYSSSSVNQNESKNFSSPNNVSVNNVSTKRSLYSQDILGTGNEGVRSQDVRTAYNPEYKKPESINVSRYEIEPQASSTDIAKLESVFRESLVTKERESTTVIAAGGNAPPLTFENVPTVLDTDLGAQLLNGVL